MITLAVDPSLNSTGVALFDGVTLFGCGRLRGLAAGVDPAHRCRAMARAVFEFVDGHPDRLAVEWPQVYKSTRSKGDPNDLLGLAGICAAVAALYPRAEVKSFLPDEWQPAPKVSPERKARKLGPIDSEAFTSPRGLRIMGRLSDAERALVPMSHDVVDAVGIGLTALGRLKKQRLYPGATEG